MKWVAAFFSLMLIATLAAANGKILAKELGIDPSSKAIRQWERVFKKERKMKKLGIDKLTDAQKDELKRYLIDHAADSDHPEAAGI